jgi:uncharacterized membrane protein YfcA
VLGAGWTEVVALVAAYVIAALATFSRPAPADQPDRPVRLTPVPVLLVLAAAVGCVGGIYGIGGGAILAPILIGSGLG